MKEIIEDRLDKLAAKIIKLREIEVHPVTQLTATKYAIKHYATDMLNLFNNIKETSLPGSDYDQRIHDLCIQFGITISGNEFY